MEKEKVDKPKPRYRVMVDGKEIVDTAYVAKICDVVEKAVKNNRKEVSIKRI